MKVHKGNKDCSYNQPPEIPELNLKDTPRHRAKKDTKRWCLGKVGREHNIVSVFKPYTFMFMDEDGYWENRCSNCKKRLRIKRKKKT
jgi:hypothetical protein